LRLSDLNKETTYLLTYLDTFLNRLLAYCRFQQADIEFTRRHGERGWRGVVEPRGRRRSYCWDHV